MMKRLHTLAAMLLICGAAYPSHANDLAGTRDISVHSAERNRDLRVTVWYPATAGGEIVQVGEDAVFKGSPAMAKTPIAGGRFPLVLLSHGSGNRAKGMSWLATHLAAAGYVVVGPDHPGTTSGDSTPQESTKLWRRTRDLSDVMDALSSDAQWRNVIDMDKVGVLGFSLGGATAMELAGARANLEAFAAYCDGQTKGDCAWLAGGVGFADGKRIEVDKVDLRKIDKARFEQLNRDSRIKSAILVDPALAQAYETQSLENIGIPMTFVNLGAPGTIFAGIDASDLVAHTSQGTLTHIEGASHYSFLPPCQDGATERLKADGDPDAGLCDEGRKTRVEIHAQLRTLILDALNTTLKTRPAR